MTAVRDTSRETYERIVASGLLTGMKLEAYKALVDEGPMTGRELDHHMYGVAGKGRDYHKRLSELVRLGVAREVGKRQCRVTGNRAYVYDVVDGAMPDLDTFRKRLEGKRSIALKAAYDEGYRAGLVAAERG